MPPRVDCFWTRCPFLFLRAFAFQNIESGGDCGNMIPTGNMVRDGQQRGTLLQVALWQIGRKACRESVAG